MSWLLQTVFIDGAELRRSVQLTRTGSCVFHCSAALPFLRGDAFLLQVTLANSWAQRWARGVVRARGTGVTTLEVSEARTLLRLPHDAHKVVTRRSAREGADLPVLLVGASGPPTEAVLLEVSADGARLSCAPGIEGREVAILVPAGAASLPLARARICWRTRALVGLEFLYDPSPALGLPTLLKVLARRWAEALPLLGPGAAVPSNFPRHPLPLAMELAGERAREQGGGEASGGSRGS